MPLLDDLLAQQAEIQKGFLRCFDGVQVRVDERLNGNEYYIAVSPTLKKQLEAAQPQNGRDNE